MTDGHRNPGRTVRPAPDEVAAAAPYLDGRTWEDLLRAAMRALAADPERTLALLAPHWPPPRRRGRPPRPRLTDTAAATASDADAGGLQHLQHPHARA